MSSAFRLDPAHLEALAELEAAGMGDGAWSAVLLEGELERSGAVSLGLGPLPRGAAALGWVLEDEAELTRIVVHPTARRQGLGRALLDTFCATCATAGARTLFLEVRADNAAAIGLYEGRGFIRLGLRPAYYRDGCDALVLSLAL